MQVSSSSALAMDPKPIVPLTQSLDASRLTITRSTKIESLPPSASLVFGKTFSPHMLLVKWTVEEGWGMPAIQPLGPLPLHPASTALHYAPTLFEGMKAYKDSNGVARLFRPDKNMERMNRGASRLGFPTFDGQVFTELIKKLVSIDSDWIPSESGCSLYIRPTMIGNRASLGIGPSDEVLMYVIMSPVGRYYATGAKPVSLFASGKDTRACEGGIGSYKFGANYAGGVVPTLEAAKLGYQQILWLYGQRHQLTEVGMMNLFVVVQAGNGSVELITPPLEGLILPGVTRDSILSLANSHAARTHKIVGLPDNLIVSEKNLFMADILEMHSAGTLLEVFGSGTAAVISGVERIGYEGKDIQIRCTAGGSGPIAAAFLREIEGIQTGKIKSDWSVVVN